MERRLVGPRTSERRRGRATRPGARGPGSRRRAGADGPSQCKECARPDCHSAGRIGSYRGMAPRSSLIITDEALSSETGKGTDFVVLLSGEPQGGIKFRQRGPGAAPHVIACLIGAHLSRVRFLPGEPVLFTQIGLPRCPLMHRFGGLSGHQAATRAIPFE